MNVFVVVSQRIVNWMNTGAGIFLVIMMMLTVTDVMLRIFGTNIVGTYELVSVLGAAVLGFAVPKTTWDKGHVCVEFFIENRSEAVRNAVFIIVRILAICLFAILSIFLLRKGIHIHEAGDVSMTLRIPKFPIVMGLALCFFVQCLVLVTDILKIFIGEKKDE